MKVFVSGLALLGLFLLGLAQTADAQGKDKHVVHGDISKLDATAKTFSVMPKKGTEVTFTIPDSCKIRVNGKKATIAELAIGQTVIVQRSKTDSAAAASINARTSKKK